MAFFQAANLLCISAKSSGRRCVHVYGLDDRDDDAADAWGEAASLSYAG